MSNVQGMVSDALASAKAKAHDAVTAARTRIGVWLHTHPLVAAGTGFALGVGFAVLVHKL
jgi:hypothetical protein